MADTRTQYNSIATDYTQRKQQFFTEHPDYVRAYILSQLTGVILEDIPNLVVFGIDPSVAMLARAKEKVRHPDNLQVAGYESIPCADQSVDCVVARFSLHYVTNLDHAYQELHRVLKPEGRIIQIVSHPTPDTLESEHFLKDDIPHVRTWLYNHTVPIEYPRHYFSEYLSSWFLQNFDLLHVTEYIGQDRDYKESPNAWGFTALKR
jgi:ubiquinone/menaquinone biosynthesis C-methylase UbiE